MASTCRSLCVLVIAIVLLLGLGAFFAVPLSFNIDSVTSRFTESHECIPSACGNIHNITSPFRLALHLHNITNDPNHCTNWRYTLYCHNNITVLRNWENYSVQAINYDNFTIRFVDPGIRSNDFSSIPRYSLSNYNFTTHRFRLASSTTSITFFKCAKAANSSVISTYNYVKQGNTVASDLEDGCRIEWTTLMSKSFLYEKDRNFSYHDIHNALGYGFELQYSIDSSYKLATIGRIHHVNVVQLVGYCVEGSRRALIYNFMPKGSLDKYVYSKDGSISLSCKQLYDISLGVAQGIEYLHRGCDMQILHFDIKPHNILLDENFIPKISDFGLAKLCPIGNTILSLTAARGTMGYMAPELFYRNIGAVSHKADVYSFGMLLMEMASRRKNLNASVEHSSQIYFPLWVWDQFGMGKEFEIDDATEEEKRIIKKMIIAALWCIQLKPSDRPSMNKVIEMLEGEVECLQPPPKLFLCPQEMPRDNLHGNSNPTCSNTELTCTLSAR